MSAAIASIPAHPLSASLVTQMGGAGSTLRATIERKGSAVLLYAVGEVDAANETIWRRLLGEAATATAAPGPLIIDANGLDFMAGCAYAALAEQADRCRIRGINLCLVSTHRIVARVVGVMKLDRQVPLYHNVDAALMATISWISPRRNIASNASPKSEPMAASSRPITPIQKWPTMKPFAPATMAIAVLLFSGCSASEVINTGGDTKCKEFTAQDEKKQNDEISKMLKDKSGAEPNNLEISATRLSALTYCQTLGTEDSKISEAPHG